MNIGDPRRQQHLTRKDKAAQKLAEDDLRRLLAQPEGRRYIARLMRSCGVEASVFSTDPRKTDLLIGQQMVGQRIRDELDRVDPEAYSRLRAEWLKDEQHDDRQQSGSGNDPADSTD